ncbi:MAG: NPCBM/NEW2 domain-containing protein [Clostridia bacterium]|nr:NPCBM/NEW2 domain-containing protein [Clostridia bacterium]MBR0277478.1 NPCBM/NEW2 domain-containing protein [Clostridia bacterium]
MFKTRKMRIITICIVVCLALCATVWAKTGSEWIEIFYSDIKLNVNGIRVNTSNNEPFIYNGTTYLPVRAVAEALGQNVDWDGNTKTVSIGSKPNGVAYLMDVCPPYQKSFNTRLYYTNEGDSFYMGGKRYNNGIEINGSRQEYAYINLNSKYSVLKMDIGRVDGQVTTPYDSYVYIYTDDILIKEMIIRPDALPQKITIPVNGCNQLKILVEPYEVGYLEYVGIGDITVE